MTGVAVFASFLAVLSYVQAPPEAAGYGFGASVLEASVVYLVPGAMAGVLVAAAVMAVGELGRWAAHGTEGGLRGRRGDGGCRPVVAGVRYPLTRRVHEWNAIVWGTAEWRAIPLSTSPGGTRMTRPTGSSPHSSSTGTSEARFSGNRTDDRTAPSGDPAPGTDEISGTRADYAPTGADRTPTTGGTIKRTLKEFSEDNLTDWAAALTYYGVLALFPALIALLSIVGLLTDPKTLTDALTAVVPGDAAETLNPVVEGLAASDSKAGFGLVLGLAAAVWSASGYVGAFTRAANVVYETPEGRKIWKLKPLQLLVTLVGILFAAVIVAMLVLSGPVVDAVGQALGLGETALTVWNVVKWPAMLVVLGLMIAVLYYATPNVKLRGFKWVSPGAAVAILVAIVASALFAFYVGNFGSYDKTYGALAGVVVFLIWFWLINLALLFGIELDAEIERTKELREGVPRADKEIQLDARDDPKPQQTT